MLREEKWVCIHSWTKVVSSLQSEMRGGGEEFCLAMHHTQSNVSNFICLIKNAKINVNPTFNLIFVYCKY
jgi:hypothetical protein